MTYFKTQNTYENLKGDGKMTKLDEILSRTEKKNSKIFNVGKRFVNIALDCINSFIILCEDEKFGKIERIIVVDGTVVKLQSADNGTPLVFVFDEDNVTLDYLEPTLEVLCNRRNVILSKITS